MDALNKNSKAAAEEKPKARFRTRDISIRKIYSNDRNFYSMPGIEQLAQEILAVGLMENMTVAYAPCERGEYKIIAGERRWRALNLLLVKGVGEVNVSDLTCDELKVALRGVGSADIHVVCDYLTARMSGVGDVTLSGTAGHADISKGGIGGVNTCNLKVGR